MHAYPRGAPTSRGFTLIEILIALLVLSIGLLGLAALQATGLRSNHSAYLRSQATALAYDIADRIRANPDGNYAIALAATRTPGTDCAAPSPSIHCSSNEMADYDISQWKASLGALLPAGDGSISKTAEVLTIVVQWDDTHGVGPPTQFRMSTRP